MNDSDRRHHLQHRLYEAEATITRLHSALATARREALEEAEKVCDELETEAGAFGHREKVGAFYQAKLAIRALLSQSVEVGPTSSGFVLVPREPTEVMLAAGDSAIPRAEPDETGFRMMGREVALECWNAMLSALPSPSTVNGES